MIKSQYNREPLYENEWDHYLVKFSNLGCIAAQSGIELQNLRIYEKMTNSKLGDKPQFQECSWILG